MVRGVRDTADEVEQGKPLDISNRIWEANPNGQKALGRALQTGPKMPVFQRVYGHLEKAPLANFVIYDGNDEASQATSALVFEAGAGERLAAGSRVFFPRSNQIMRFTADFTSTTLSAAVARNFGRGTTTSYLRKGDRGLILTPSMIEGFTTGEGLSSTKEYKSFGVTEISYPVEATYVEVAERSRAGDPFTEAVRDAWVQAKEQMEAELLFGAKVTDDTTYTHPISASEGIDNYITTHRYYTNKVSRMDFWDILLEWTKMNKDGGDIWCSPEFKSQVTEWAFEHHQIVIPITGQQGQGSYGMSVEEVLTPSGRFTLVDIDLLGMEEYLMGKVFLVPPGRIAYRPLIENLNLDIAYNPISRDEVHAKEGEIYGVYGWEFFQEELWACIDGLEF
jgi:hypothetical protein